jgi:glycosyltransferase involved in cell wall biosynthesis
VRRWTVAGAIGGTRATDRTSGAFVFAGSIPPARLQVCGWMDTLVHLSSREGLPLRLAQAAGRQATVVAFECDGAGEVCRAGRPGFLVPRGDQHGLVKAVTALANDPTLRRRLGAAGQSWVTERFTIERLVEDQVQLYTRLASRRPVASEARRRPPSLESGGARVSSPAFHSPSRILLPA